MKNHPVRSPLASPRTTRCLGGLVAALAVVSTAACGRSAPPIVPQPMAAAAAPAVPVVESTEPYRQAGFLVGDGPVPFVGISRYFATESADSTIVLVALSIPPRALSFVRAGDRYAAYYSVKADFMSGPTLVKTERPSGEVRVASIDETKRGDEGIIFQRAFKVAPGNYSLRLVIQDSIGAGTGTSTSQISVPSFASSPVASMLPVYTVTPRERRSAPILATVNPRSTLRYGRDGAMQIYVEAYDRRPADTLVLSAIPAQATVPTKARDTAVLIRAQDVSSGTFFVPAASLELGLNRLVATSTDGTVVGSTDVRVSVGEDFPVTSFSELWAALKYFATDAEIRDVRDVAPDKRPARWAALMRRTDPNPGTPENEALREYARRIRVATARYREDARPAWETDRGMVLIALGEPDIINNPAPVDSSLTRVQTWEYRRHRLLLVFYDQGGVGKWRLTTYSEADFKSLVNVAGPCIGCS